MMFLKSQRYLHSVGISRCSWGVNVWEEGGFCGLTNFLPFYCIFYTFIYLFVGIKTASNIVHYLLIRKC